MSESPSSNTEPNDCFPLKMLADLFSILFNYDRLLSFVAMKTFNKTSNILINALDFILQLKRELTNPEKVNSLDLFSRKLELRTETLFLPIPIQQLKSTSVSSFTSVGS